jgi:hypothetical protein
LLVDHEGKDSHHGGTALVELDGALLQLGLSIKCVPSVVNGTVAEVTREFSLASQIAHDTGLEDTNEEKELDKSSGRDLLEGGEAVGDIGEALSREVDGSREADSGLLDEVSDNGEHGNTSVLQFDESEAVELFLVTVSDKAERVEEAKRGLGAELVLESHVHGSGGGLLLGRDESRSGGDEGGGDNSLHIFNWQFAGK